MLLTMALVILGSCILVLFSKEFGNLAKTILAIPGMKLLLPLVLANLLFVIFESWVTLFIFKTKSLLHLLVASIENVIPFTTGADFLAHFLVLLALTLLPVYALNAWSLKKKDIPYAHPFLLSTVIWLSAALLLTVEVTIFLQ